MVVVVAVAGVLGEGLIPLDAASRIRRGIGKRMALRSCTAREVVKARKKDRAARDEEHAADAGPFACSAPLAGHMVACRMPAAVLPSACMGMDEVLLVLHAVLDDRRSSTHGSFDDGDDVRLLLLLLLHAARRLRGKPPRALLIAVRPASSAMPAGCSSITHSVVDTAAALL